MLTHERQCITQRRVEGHRDHGRAHPIANRLFHGIRVPQLLGCTLGTHSLLQDCCTVAAAALLLIKAGCHFMWPGFTALLSIVARVCGRKTEQPFTAGCRLSTEPGWLRHTSSA